MKDLEEVSLDNKTIAKLAIAIATAMQLRDNEVIGPLTRKVLDTLDNLDSLPHFADYSPKGKR